LLTSLARRYQIIVSAGSLMMAADPDNPEDNRAANRSFLITQDGAIAGRYDKIHMFDADVGDGKSYRESDHFRPGTSIVDVPTNKAHFGLTICYDVRFASLYRNLAQRGAEIITIPAAFTRPSGQAHWHVLQRARAIETGCFVLASAQIGTHDDGRKTYGHSLIVNPWGEVLADAGTMEEGFVMAALDLGEVTIARQKIRNLQHAPDYC
jgi:predicted amidohydrolase